MNAFKTVSRNVATAGLLSLACFAGNAFAIGDVDYPNLAEVRTQIAKMREMPMANKDAVVTRAQYLEMQGKLFDAMTKDGKMTMPQFKAFMNEFKTFGQ